ncbi:MAG: DGQHR domain-containing protein DpdB [Bryobacteraceae bacterium]
MRKRLRALRKRTLRIDQCEGHPLYLLSMTGAELLSIAEVSRVSRDEAGKLIGYQRTEVKRHVQDIVEYLNSDNVLFPNSLILALSSRVKFTASRGPAIGDRGATPGILEIPLPVNGAPKPAWIVDGQQRALAISKSRRQSLSIPINAFIADDVESQRDQFLRVNNTKPLPRGLITELLPKVSTPLPSTLEARKIPSALCDLLNTDPISPFHALIRRTSSSARDRKKAVIADASIIKMIQESISSPSGCLFPYRNMASGETDFTGIWRVLIAYWTAVKQTFPDAWGKPPNKSRLMHGAGLRAMGRLMDRVMASINPQSADAMARAMVEVQVVAPLCRWTTGRWTEIGDLNWDDVQNVPRHIRLLSSFLVRSYVHHRGAGR